MGYFVRINRCNVVIFYGHGIKNWYELTPELLSMQNLPSVVLNDECSSAEVYGCYTGNYVRIQTPTPGAENPTDWVNINSDMDQLWARARAQAKAICERKDSCCSEVTITFEHHLPFGQRAWG